MTCGNDWRLSFAVFAFLAGGAAAASGAAAGAAGGAAAAPTPSRTIAGAEL